MKFSASWLQDRPRWPQDGPKTGQDGPKISQDGAKEAPRRAKKGTIDIDGAAEGVNDGVWAPPKHD